MLVNFDFVCNLCFYAQRATLLYLSGVLGIKGISKLVQRLFDSNIILKSFLANWFAIVFQVLQAYS